MKDPNELIFTRSTLEAAMATNCGYYHGHSVQERFAVETPILIKALDGLLRDCSIVMDYGIGVGRVTKAILKQYPHLRVIGVDNSDRMLGFARQYIPTEYFDEGQVELYSTQDLKKIGSASIDLILAVYVLMHISERNLETTFDELSRVMNEQAKLYVFNQTGRSVPRENRWGIYRGLRVLTGFLDEISQYKQAQRMLLKVDNRTIFHNDGIDIQKELEKKFRPLHDVPLDSHPLVELLMRRHFSRVYAKRLKISE